MFSFQKNFTQPTMPVDESQFYALVRGTLWAELIDRFRQTGDQSLKRKLPAFIFQATFDETLSKAGKMGRWRKQAATRLTGLVVMDIDHLNRPTPERPTPDPSRKGGEASGRKEEMLENMSMAPRELFQKWQQEHPELFGIQAQPTPSITGGMPNGQGGSSILLVYITPSGKGLKIVFKADAAKGNLIDNQHAMAEVLGVEVDESCKDASRMSFICKEEDILYLDKELFTYENREFAEKYTELYREGKSKGVAQHPKGGESKQAANQPSGNESPSPGDGLGVASYHGVPYSKIVEAWLGDKQVEPGDRHRTSLVLADHLRYITDNDASLIEQILRQTPFVKDIVKERNEDVAQTVKSAQGYEFLKGIPRRMQKALEAAGATSKDESLNAKASTLRSQGDDIYAQLPLDKWAEELQELSKEFPCMKELFLNVHPHKLPAVLFSSAALFGTLMTRAWYHFWYEPEVMRRLNYCIFIIGDPGAGKNVIEKFYFKIAEPMIQADQAGIDAVNRYKEGRTERTTSTKAQKGDALKKPVVAIRVHPARTATGEFIRHMLAAVETIQGQRLNLHMFSFDSELDNVTKNNKGGDWKDREIMELKAFHNEQDGQMYANQESITGMFNVFWNFIYTGTPYALHRKVNQRNFGTGMSTRLAVIPLPDKGLAQRHQQVDPAASETLSTWAQNLNKVEGEIPIEPLNDETYEWQSSHLEIAEFNGDKADRSLLKRIPYYGIGISLPFILMRHWDEWQESKTLTMDEVDKRLCRLAMEIQYRCQHFFFGEMAFNYYADQNKEFVVRKRTTRYSECFRKLPDEFKTQQFMEVFEVSQQAASRAITRFRNDGVIEVVKYGLYKKAVSELP